MFLQSLTPNQQLVLDTIHMKPTRGLPGGVLLNPMEWTMIDRMAGEPPGTYEKHPKPTYLTMLRNASSCMVDQWLWQNPLSMRSQGYTAESDRRNRATTGATDIVLDGMRIDSPERVVEHLEKVMIPQAQDDVRTFDEPAWIQPVGEHELAVQEEIGDTMLKTMHGKVRFPGFLYGAYGYENYFMAYALYPEVLEAYFKATGDLWRLRNQATVKAFDAYDLPRVVRLDHDMADSRGTLVSLESLDRLWFPHFCRALEPVAKTDIKMIWHSDGNLMGLYPRLLEAGIKGFQGFQYEDGMDYEKICAMKGRNGEELLIEAGVSVTRTLPRGTADEVRQEMKYLVENGPRVGLMLGCSSSIAPGVPWANIKAMMDGFAYYRQHARG